MAKLTEEYHNRARKEGTKNCALCRGNLDTNESERGVVEFYDGWFWICSICKLKVGKDFDHAQKDDYGDCVVIPYFKRSRRYFLKWLKEECEIEIRQQN